MGEIRMEPKRLRGPAGMVIAYILAGHISIFVRLAGDNGWSGAHSVFARFLFTLVVIGVFSLIARRPLRPVNKKLLVARGVLGGVAVLLFFTAVNEIGAGKATLLNYTFVVWANIYSVLLYRRRPFRAFWWLLAVAMVGIYLVVDPASGPFKLWDVLALISGMLAGGALMAIKELRRTDQTLTILASFSIFGLLFCLLPVLTAGAADLPLASAVGWWAILGVAVVGFSLQALLTYGFKGTSLALGTLLGTLTPLIATFMGWLIFDEPLTWKYLVGAAMILAVCVVSGVKERGKVGQG